MTLGHALVTISPLGAKDIADDAWPCLMIVSPVGAKDMTNNLWPRLGSPQPLGAKGIMVGPRLYVDSLFFRG